MDKTTITRQEKGLKVIHIEVPEKDFQELKKICQKNNRTSKGQIMHWINGGR